MSAPVRIEAAAFADFRFEMLGELAGYDRYSALGRMAHLWSTCTDRETDVLSEGLVRACLGPRGVDAIVAAELGERVEGGIRVKGAGPERIGWLGDHRARSVAGGRARAASAARAAGGRFTSQPPAGLELLDQPTSRAGRSHQPGWTSPPASDQPATSQRPASSSPLSLSLSLSPEREEQDPPPLASLGEPPVGAKPKRRGQLPGGWSPSEEHSLLAASLGLVNHDEAARFRDWALSKGEVKADWGAAYRNWLRRSADQRGSRAGPARKATTSAADLWAEADQLEAEGR